MKSIKSYMENCNRKKFFLKYYDLGKKSRIWINSKSRTAVGKTQEIPKMPTNSDDLATLESMIPMNFPKQPESIGVTNHHRRREMAH